LVLKINSTELKKNSPVSWYDYLNMSVKLRGHRLRAFAKRMLKIFGTKERELRKYLKGDGRCTTTS
jgi:hypothetical protein